MAELPADRVAVDKSPGLIGPGLIEARDIAELLVIRVPVQAIVLEGLDVSAGRRCEVRPEAGKTTARVWDEVRKALAAG